MTPQPTRPLMQAGRTHAPVLLQGLDDPHAELLSLVWGPRFDRVHALGLWARLSQQQPTRAAPLLPVLLSAADHFDALGGPGQHRVRRVILRHRARCLEGGLSESTP